MAHWYSVCDYKLFLFGIEPYWLEFTADSPCDAVNSMPEDGFAREFLTPDQIYYDAPFIFYFVQPYWASTELSPYPVFYDLPPGVGFSEPYWASTEMTEEDIEYGVADRYFEPASGSTF